MRRLRQKSASGPTPEPGPPTREPELPEYPPPAERGSYRRRDGVEAVERRAPAEIVAARELALQLVASGAPRSLVLQTLRAELSLTKVQAEHDYSETCAELKGEFEQARTFHKAQQVERLQRDLARMRAAGPGQTSYRAIAQHEALLARITGTIEPVRVEARVDANLRESFVAVLAGLGQSEQDKLVAEQLELERRAGAQLTEGEPTEH